MANRNRQWLFPETCDHAKSERIANTADMRWCLDCGSIDSGDGTWTQPRCLLIDSSAKRRLENEALRAEFETWANEDPEKACVTGKKCRRKNDTPACRHHNGAGVFQRLKEAIEAVS